MSRGTRGVIAADTGATQERWFHVRRRTYWLRPGRLMRTGSIVFVLWMVSVHWVVFIRGSSLIRFALTDFRYDWVWWRVEGVPVAHINFMHCSLHCMMVSSKFVLLESVR